MGETTLAPAPPGEASSEIEGTIESYKGHGVFVPRGLTAAAVMEGAWELERQFDVAPFISRMMATAVLEAVCGLEGRTHSPAAAQTNDPYASQA